MGRNQKRNKKAKIQTGSRNSVAGLRSGQCAGSMNSGKQEENFATYEILQVAKISQPCKIFTMVLFLLFSALLSFWFLICNVEFDSKSSCLD